MKRLFKIILIMMLFVHLIGPIVIHAETEEEMTPINEEIFYHILVDRFNNGDHSLNEEVDIDDQLAYHGGDLKGITKKLDSLSELGFTTIVLSPIMKNAKKGYHGYWIEDFFDVEPQFGTLDDLNELIKEAHDRKMKVVLELVTNYVAKSHPIVNDDEKTDWFTDHQVEPIEATEWLKEVVAFDQTNEEVQDYLIDVVDFWMDETKIDGFKLHAADQISEPFLEKMVTHIKDKNSQFYLIAGTLQGDPFNESVKNIEHIDVFEDVNMFEVLNEVFTEPDVPVSKLYDVWEQLNDEKLGLYVDNINTARFSNNFAENGRNAQTVWQLTLAFLYTAPGVPIVYQGSEVPMYGPGYPENQYIVDFTAGDQDLQKIFEKMALIRDNYKALSHGDFEQIAVDEGMSLFKRTFNDESIYIAINNDSHSRSVSIDGLSENLQLRGLLQDHTVRQNKEGLFRIGIDRESTEIFVVQPNVGINWVFIGFVAGVFIIFIGAILLLTRAQKRRENM